jgi:hypothetical protein
MGFEGKAISAMKFDRTVDLVFWVFAVQLKPSAPVRFIHFRSPSQVKTKLSLSLNRLMLEAFQQLVILRVRANPKPVDMIFL